MTDTIRFRVNGRPVRLETDGAISLLWTLRTDLEFLQIDGRLDEISWQIAPRSPRFVDLISGQPTIHNTQAAVLWDDEYLYVGYWIEEPFVTATLTERDTLIYNDNDVELFIAGPHAYYEFEINDPGHNLRGLFYLGRSV